MSLFHEMTPANIKREIAQIDFIFANPADKVAQIFLEHWPIHQLKERREWLAGLLKLSPRRRNLVIAQLDIIKSF